MWTTVLAKVWEWLKARWQWVLLVLGLLAVLVRLRPKITANTATVEAETHKREVENKTQEEVKKAEEKKEEVVVALKKERVEAIATLTQAEERRAKELEDDSKGVNDFLRGVSSDIQK
jgi:predicted RNA-binding protein with PUA domain